MSPELFCPEKFGLEDGRRTKRSDCYALGMVIYEVLSGQVPFPSCGVYAVVVKVTGGERPGRPGGAEGIWFADTIWEILERCWTPKPDDRPMTEDVLRCLEVVSRAWMPLSQTVANPPAWNSSDSDNDGSIEESEASSLSQSLQALPPKGEVDDRIPILTLSDTFTAPLYEVTNNQSLGVYVKNPGESGPDASVEVLGRVSWR
jgi:hypothetical protein